LTQPAGPVEGAVDRLRADYDETPYTSDAFPQSAPGRLAAIAHVFGLAGADPATARVLEIGCAAGGNLLPFAAMHPRADVVGIDLSPVQIEAGRARAAAMDLKNLDFVAADIAAVDPNSLGQFDYVIAHGVYSWVPDDVRDALLATIRGVLAPAGVAYVSYNTFPGWKSKQVMRDAMLLAGGAAQTPEDKVREARGMVEFLEDVAPPDGVLARTLAEFRARDEGFGDSYLLHDELEAFNTPRYFYEMVDHTRRHGLAYLAEAHPESMFPANHGPKVAEYVAAKCGGVQVLVEQYLDFATNRAFRESLLVHAERARQIRYDLDRSRFAALHFAANSPVVEGETRIDHSRQEYEVADATLFTNDPGLKVALETLTAAWPWTLSRQDLVAEVYRRLSEAGFTPGANLGASIDELMGVLVAQGHAQYRLAPVRPTESPDGMPALHPAIRRMAELSRGDDSIFNPWHEPLIPTPLDRVAFPLLDGTRDPAALRAALPDGPETDAYLDALPDRLKELKLA
jgi:SAM-dependent methyltransferase